MPFRDDDSDSVGTTSERDRSGRKTKLSGACVDCKSVKVRCEFLLGERKCRRCQSKNLPCQSRERKKRKPAEQVFSFSDYLFNPDGPSYRTHEQLQERSHEQDLQIQDLLHQYDQMRAEQKVNHWIAKASQTSSNMADVNQNMKWLYKGKSPESAAISYFPPASSEFPISVPEVIKHCSLYPEEVVELFAIYFRDINPYFSILDPDYHTAQKLIWTSPFLFTVMCAVASRYYTTRASLYPLAMEFARELAGRALIEGSQSVEICQAYLIMAVYPAPQKKFAEDRSWLLTGVAIRMAMELGLDQPPPPSCDERESLNLVRTWLQCYSVDGAHAIQYGKTPMLTRDDYLASHSRYWYKSSALNTPYDIHLCTYVQLVMHMSEWREYLQSEAAEVADHSDIISSALKVQDKLSRELDSWEDFHTEEYAFMPLPICNYRTHTTHMIVAYLRLAVLLAAFQRASKDEISRTSEIFVKSVDAARTVIQLMLERLYPSGYLRFAIDSTFLYVSFAAAFLLHLFRPRYRILLGDNLQREIATLVSRLVTVLGASDVALDGKHTPALYSRFLSTLMTKHNVSARKPSQFATKVESRSSSSTYSMTTESDSTTSDVFHWPLVQPPQSQLNNTSGINFRPEADFSLSHFIRSVTSQSLASNPSLISITPESVDPWDAWTNDPMVWPSPTPELDAMDR